MPVNPGGLMQAANPLIVRGRAAPTYRLGPAPVAGAQWGGRGRPGANWRGLGGGWWLAPTAAGAKAPLPTGGAPAGPPPRASIGTPSQVTGSVLPPGAPAGVKLPAVPRWKSGTGPAVQRFPGAANLAAQMALLAAPKTKLPAQQLWRLPYMHGTASRWAGKTNPGAGWQGIGHGWYKPAKSKWGAGVPGDVAR